MNAPIPVQKPAAPELDKNTDIGAVELTDSIVVNGRQIRSVVVKRPKGLSGFDVYGPLRIIDIAINMINKCTSPAISYDDIKGMPPANIAYFEELADAYHEQVQDAIRETEEQKEDDLYKLRYPVEFAGNRVDAFVIQPVTVDDIVSLRRGGGVDFAKQFLQRFCRVQGRESETIFNGLIEQLDLVDIQCIAAAMSAKKKGNGGGCTIA